MAGPEASQTPSRQPQTPPAPLTPAWLRTHFDPLPFPARMGALARYARTLTPHAYETLRHALATGDPDERHTALFLSVARRDLERVVEALTDPLLGRRARSAALRLPVPEQALERLALSEISAVRQDTYRLLRLSRRTDLAARLLPTIHERHGAREAAALLPACPAQTVTAWLPRVDAGPGTLNSLARTAPRALAAHLAAQHERYAHREAHRFTHRHRAVASLAAHRDPGAALLLLERAPDLLTPHAVRAALHRPAEALTVLRAARPDRAGRRPQYSIPAGPLPPGLRRTLLALPVEDRVALAELCPPTGNRNRPPDPHETAPDGLLLLLPPAERRRVVENRTGARRLLSRAALSTLAALEPADRADLIAPRFDGYRGSPWMTARLAVALPLADGEPALRDLAGNHRAHVRAVAWPGLLACAELDGDPEEFARIAAACERAWHDQEEVRRPALEQLARTAPRLLAAVPERVLRDAVLTTVQSRDSTAATLAAAERLLYRVAERAATQGRAERAALAVALLGELVSAPRHTAVLTALNVDEPTARTIWTAMAPTALRSPETGTALAELLGPHLTALPGLDAEARRIAAECDNPHLAARAAAAWAWPPHLRERRCAELVALDPTFATLPLVLRTLTARRTDLLDPVLDAARAPFTGRLRPRPVPWTPKLHPGVTGRWPTRQRQAWARHHARVALDDSAPLHTRADAARLLRDPALLTALADEAPQPVAAAALTALGEAMAGTETEPGRTAATPRHAALRDLLLGHAATGGVRGRAAMASLRRLIAHLPDADAVTLLAPVVRATDAPVGTRKEAARALAGLERADAFAALLAGWDAPGQHADVRAVLARALLPGLGRPGVADRLLHAVHEPAVRDAVVHARVRAVSDTGRDTYTEFLTRLVDQADDDTVVAACHALPSWLDRDSTDAMRLLADLTVAPHRSRAVWRAAACQLVRLPPGPDTVPIVRGAFDALADRTRARDPQLRVDALRRLHECADVVRPGLAGRESLPVLDALADTLDAVGLHTDAAHLSWQAAVESLRHGRHARHRWDRLLRLCEAGPGRLPESRYLPADFHQERVRAAALATARTLRARGTALSGLLALGFVRVGGRAADWTQPWRAELDALRTHTDPDTAMGALLVDPDRSR